jgi:hypothetical protein
MLSTYRFRYILQLVGGDLLRTFPVDNRLQKQRRGYAIRPKALWDGESTVFSRAQLKTIRRRLRGGPRTGIAAFNQFTALMMLSDMAPGRHAEVQLALLRRAIARLRAHGVRVVILDTPVHPAVAPLLNAAARREFTAFATEVAMTDGVEFVPLEALEAFRDEDFRDVLHLNATGAPKLTRGIVHALRQEEAQRARTGAWTATVAGTSAP